MTIYLTEGQIVAINYKLILETSPKEQMGLKEDSALNMIVESLKQHAFDQEMYPSLLLKAANIYRNLVLKHVFFNSNKRTAFTCMEIFLFLNGVKIKIPTVEGIEFTVRIATEKLDEADIANWIEKFIVKS